MNKYLLYCNGMMSGYGLYVANLANALAELGGAEVHLLTSANVEPAIGRLLDQSEVHLHRDLAPVNVHRATMSDYFRWHVDNYRKLYLCMRSLKPDIVHIQFTLYLTHWIIPYITKCQSTPSILTVHNVTPLKWMFKNLCGLDERILRVGYHRYPHLIVHTQDGYKELVSRYKVKPSCITQIPHAIEQNEVVPWRERKRRICLLGALRQNKGVVEAIRGYQALEMSTRKEWKLIIRGKAPDKHYLREIVHMINAAPTGIDFAEGYLSDREFRNILRNSSYCLLPYVDFHAQSGVAAMAISYCVPIIATDVPGLRDLVEDMSTGFCIRGAPDSASIADTIRRAVSSVAYEQLVDNLKLTRDLYSWHKVAKAHEELYRRIISQRNE